MVAGGHQTAGFGRSEADQSEVPMVADGNQTNDLANDSEIQRLAHDMMQRDELNPRPPKSNTSATVSLEFKRDSQSGIVKPPRNPILSQNTASNGFNQQNFIFGSDSSILTNNHPARGISTETAQPQ